METNNTNSTEILNANSATTALSREELASYMIYTENVLKDISSHMSELINNIPAITSEHSKSLQVMSELVAKQIDFSSGFMSAIIPQQNDFFKSTNRLIRKQTSLINKVIDHLPAADTPSEIPAAATTETEDPVDLNEWLYDVNVRIIDYCKKNDINEISFINRIVVHMSNAKKNIPTYYETQFCLANICINKELRELFEESLQYLLDGNKVHTESEKAVCVPNEIYDAIKPLVFEGESGRSQLLSVYREMNRRISPQKLTKLKDEFCRERGISHSTTGYFIASTPHLMELFNEVVKSRL